MPISDDSEYESPFEYFKILLTSIGGGGLMGPVISTTVTLMDQRDVQNCSQHVMKADCTGTGPGGVCCIWVVTQVNSTINGSGSRAGECRAAAKDGFSEMLCRPRLPSVLLRL